MADELSKRDHSCFVDIVAENLLNNGKKRSVESIVGHRRLKQNDLFWPTISDLKNYINQTFKIHFVVSKSKYYSEFTWKTTLMNIKIYANIFFKWNWVCLDFYERNMELLK